MESKTSNTRPEVSVVMPAFNAASTIANAINSILNQSFEDFELIVVDDDSTDNTAEVVAKFKDHRIRYEVTPHRGIVHARNFGNSLARGEYIAIQDADDLSLPDRLSKCLYLFDHIGIDVVVHGAYINMWDGQYQCIGRKYLHPGNPSDKKALLKGQTLTGMPIFRKSIWEKKPFRYETQFAYDYMMHLDWKLSGFRYFMVDEGLYEYVRHENSASQVFERDGRRKQSMEEIKKIVKKEYGETVSCDA